MKSSAHNRVAQDSARDVTDRLLSGGGRPGAVKSAVFQAAVLSCVLIAIVTLLAVIGWAIVAGWDRLDLNLLTQMPSGMRSRLQTSGLQSAIVGSLMVMAGLAVTVLPLGIAAAVFLEEFADQERWYTRVIEVSVQNLAAVPSIVFGILGLAFIMRGPLSFGSVVYTGSLTLALLVLPTVIVTSREAIRSVPNSIRLGSMALGATRWRTVWHQVLPVSIPGIITGAILALSRAIGEAAPLIMIGTATFVTFNPAGFFEGRFTVLPVQIYYWSSQANDDFHVLAAAGVIVLIAMLLSLNSFAIWVRARASTDY
ncbi:MAG: phosphate ABC transporter permease PstA [Nitriliruptoraceae bacterium]